MTSTPVSPQVRGRDELLARAARAPDALALFAEVSSRLRRLVPFDAAVWRVTDPVTGLQTAPIRVENLGEDGCTVYWDCALITEDLNSFQDLIGARVPATSLRATTGDLLGRSALYRRYLRPRGLHDELRAVLRTGGRSVVPRGLDDGRRPDGRAGARGFASSPDPRPWGQISLFRQDGRAPFTTAETELVASLSTPLARRLRTYAEPRPEAVPDAAHGPGLLLFDAAGNLLSINDEARHHLAGMPDGPSTCSPLGIRLPTWLHSTAGWARAIAERREQGTARIRVRDGAGRWLVCHASCLRQGGGELGPTAVVVEPAKASDVTPLIAEAYDLSGRELEIAGCIARGLSTGEIAGQLFISPHTVRDHVKAIFEKAGVSSRGELVAKLFTEHYEPFDTSGVVRVWDA